MRTLVLATRNEHKVRELVELLHGLPFELKTLNDFPHLPLVEEDGKTYFENAIKKALTTAKFTGELAMADDSGLEVHTLGGKPGIFSSRFAPDDPTRIRKLLQTLESTQTKDRGAQFICVVAIAEPNGQVWTVQASCHGMISPTPLGENGFGYDPVFLIPELKKTFAQLSSFEKAQYGHRGKAVRNARLVLQKISARSASPIHSKEDVKISRYASIDIGTNCLRLLIAELDKDHKFKPFIRHSEIVRLGQGMHNKMLTPGGMNRVFQQMDKYMDILEKYPVLDIHIGATSAVRDAANQDEFLGKFFEKYKMRVSVLSAEEEAKLTFIGASSDISLDNLLVIDVGGGSTEFVTGKQGNLDKAQSLNLGSIRFTEKYIYHDPVIPLEIENVVKHIQEGLKSLELGQIDSSFKMIGSGGTITTIAAMSQHMERYDSSKIHGYKLSTREVEMLAEELGKRSILQRKELPGLDPMRADVILVGVLICREIMYKYELNELKVSERDLLDGLIISHMTTESSIS